MPTVYDTLLDQQSAPQEPRAPQPSVYDKLLDTQEQAEQAATGVVLNQVMGTPADRAARAQELAQSTRLPLDVVERNFDEVNRRDQARRLQDAMAFSPMLRRQMTDPQFAALAHDDAEPLGSIERVLAPAISTMRAIPAGLQKIATGAAYGVPELLARAGSEYLGQYLAGTVLPEDPFARVADGFSEWRKGGLAFGDKIAGEAPQGFVASSIVSGGESFGRMLPGLIMTIITKNPAYAIGAGALDQGVASATTGLDKGLSASQALAYGAQDAVAEAITERLPMGRLIGDLKAGAPLWKLLRNQIATEVPTELAATAWQNFNEWANLNPDQPFSSYLKELPAAEAQTVIATITTTVLTAGLAGGINRIADRATVQEAKARAADQGAQQLQALTTFAAASKLAARAPDTFEQFIAQAADGGQAQQVFIGADALMQSGVAEQVAAVSPSVAAQLDTAQATGGQIAIPVEEFAARIAPTEYAQGLLDHLKTDPEGFSRAEAQVYLQTQQDTLTAEFERAAAQQESDDAFRASADVVRAGLKAQLDAAGRFNPQANEAYSTLVGSMYAVQAARLGTTPEALYQRYPLRVVAEGVTDAAVLDQGKAQPVASLTGEEIAPHGADIKTLRTQAKAWYAGNLAGTVVHNSQLGDVQFSNRGLRKMLSSSANPAKLKLVSALPQIIANGTLVRSLDNRNTDTHPNIVRYHWLQGNVLLDGESLTVEVNVEEHKDGKLYYNHTLPGSEYFQEGGVQARNPSIPGVISPAERSTGGEHQSEALGSEPPVTSVEQNGDDLNLRVLDQSARGTFSPSTLTISLLRDADLSTFLHETGHFFLEVQADLAGQPDAPEAIRQDMQTVLDWFGVPDLAAWQAMDLEQKRPYHEQFARGFEAYLFEGKAPSIELHGLFQRFRAWLLNVYKKLSALNVTLSDDVRGVFDRMLASGEQIDLAEQGRSMLPLFETAEQAGMTQEEFAAYQALGVDATADAIEDLQTRGLRDMRWLHNARGRELKRLQKEVDARRAEVRQEVRQEVESLPVYRAWRYLTAKAEGDTPPRLSRAVLDEMYGGAVDGKRDRYALLDWKRLTDLRMTADEGLPPDIVAELHGFSSGDELVRALLAAERPETEIDTRTDARMLEQYGDIASPEALARAADEAIHNEARARFTATEANALARATGQRKILLDAAREFARATVSRLRVRAVRPGQYANAEARAAQNAERAMKAGDLARAAAEKRNQVVQQQLTRAAYNAREDIDKTLRYLKKFDSAGVRKNLDADYLDQIDAMLERFDLRSGQSLKAIDKRTSLAAWIEARSDEGTEPDIAPWLAAEANRTHYKNLTVEQVRGLADAVKQIEHLGRLKHKLLTTQDKRALDAIVEALNGSITANSRGPVDNEKRNTLGSKTRRVMRGLLAAHRKFANLVREMDGFKDGGPLWDKIIRPMNDAGNKETTMRAEASRRLNALVQPVLAESGLDVRTRMGGKGEYFASLGRNLNHGERLAIALNLGNEGNQQRLLDGRSWTIEQVKPVLDTLTTKDWQMVQGVWDFFESFRPEIAALERSVRGGEPDWVEPVPLTVRTADGQTLQLRGGYYPVKYDRDLSGKAGEQQDRQDAKDLMGAANTAATTRRSFTKQRAEEVHGQPIDLSFSGIFQGANEVIHDLAWRPWLIDANKLIRRLDAPMRNGYGAQTVNAIRAALKDIAQGDKPATDAIESTLNHLRTGATVAGLGWNLKTALLQPLGVTQSMARVGTVWMARGIREFYGDPMRMAAKVREVNEQSDFMANRARTMNREINEVLNQLSGAKGKYQTMLEGSFFVLIQKAQMTVDYPTWLAAYAKAEADPANIRDNGDLDTQRVVALADQAVIDAQGEGQIKDLAQVQRGHPALKLFTNFYSYFSTSLNLAVDATKRTNIRDPRQVAALAGDYLLIGILPAVMGALLNALWDAVRGADDDDDESLIKRLVSEQIDYLMGMFVGLREVSGSVKKALGMKNPFGYAGPAGLRFFAEMDRLGSQIGQGELDSALARSANNTAGILFHYPAGQVQRTVEGVSALVEGRTHNPMAAISGYRGR